MGSAYRGGRGARGEGGRGGLGTETEGRGGQGGPYGTRVTGPDPSALSLGREEVPVGCSWGPETVTGGQPVASDKECDVSHLKKCDVSHLSG